RDRSPQGNALSLSQPAQPPDPLNSGRADASQDRGANLHPGTDDQDDRTPPAGRANGKDPRLGGRRTRRVHALLKGYVASDYALGARGGCRGRAGKFLVRIWRLRCRAREAGGMCQRILRLAASPPSGGALVTGGHSNASEQRRPAPSAPIRLSSSWAALRG